jgi:hypothetical protein
MNEKKPHNPTNKTEAGIDVHVSKVRIRPERTNTKLIRTKMANRTARPPKHHTNKGRFNAIIPFQ